VRNRASPAHVAVQLVDAGRQLRGIERLGHPPVEAAFYVAGLLFSLGMAVIARSQLETTLWLLLALTFVAQLVILRRSR